MADKKIIAVVGATGSQGGGLVRAIQRDANGPYRARALTRTPDSPKAKELARLGAEVARIDVDDPSTVAKAFEGADGAFCVSFFWAHYSPEQEMAEAKDQADGAREAGVKHVIWSTLEDTRRFIPLSDKRIPTLFGQYKVPHFDAKGSSDKFFADLPVTNLITSFYWDNFIHFGMGPKRNVEGKLVLSMPMADKPLGAIAAEDIGKCAYSIFKRGKEFIGKTVGIIGQSLTGAQMAASLTKALGEEVTYSAIPIDVFRGLGFPGAEDIGNMYQYYVEFQKDFESLRDAGLSRQLNPELQTLDTWLVANAGSIPLA